MKGTIHFDGACSGNPGPMGAGAVVDVGGARHVVSEAVGRGTNNEAEYYGIIVGLRRALDLGVTAIVVYGDSQLVLRQLGGQYKVRKEHLRPLWKEASALLARFTEARLAWIPRDENSDADAAARSAIGT